MTTTQQLPSNPALDFADLVLTETNNGLELIDILHDIAQGIDEDATTHDRITASNILLDRGLGKCPKQLRIPSTESERDPESAESDSHANHSSDTPHNAPDSPRLVTRIDETLNQSVGPAPTAHNPLSLEGEGLGEGEKNPFDPFSIHFIIQQHILDITNNGRTLFDTLAEIARAKDSPKAKPCHRARASRILMDRALGANPNAARSAVCPGCRQGWKDHSCPPVHPESDRRVSPGRKVRYIDPVKLAEARAKIQRMKDEGILTPDPNAPLIDISSYRMPKDFDITPYAKEEAASFWADIELRIERQKKWPEIEERRRKKLALIYPSHSDDVDDPPDP